MPPPPAKAALAKTDTAYKSPVELEQLARNGKLTAEELKAQVALGFDDLDQGRYIELHGEEELRAYIAGIGQRARERNRAKQAE